MKSLYVLFSTKCMRDNSLYVIEDLSVQSMSEDKGYFYFYLLRYYYFLLKDIITISTSH